VHELALAREIVDQILEACESEHLGRVSRVVLELGTDAGVDADALSFGFQIAARRSVADGAALEIDRVPNGRDLRVKILEGS
jgi:hydrogenase nickel incorporation protein HypA/HybF